MQNPYEVLGVSPNATDEEIKKAYKELVKKYHPDRYAGSDLADLASEKMKEVNAAYTEIEDIRSGKKPDPYGNAYGGAYRNPYGNPYGNPYANAGRNTYRASDASQNGGSRYEETREENAGSEEYAIVRRLINCGRIEDAEDRLEDMDERERGAEWYFLMGVICSRRAEYSDAMHNFDAACRIDPYNVEYRMARDSLRNRAADYGRAFDTSATSSAICDLCSCLCCSSLCSGFRCC